MQAGLGCTSRLVAWPSVKPSSLVWRTNTASSGQIFAIQIWTNNGLTARGEWARYAGHRSSCGQASAGRTLICGCSRSRVATGCARSPPADQPAEHATASARPSRSLRRQTGNLTAAVELGPLERPMQPGRLKIQRRIISGQLGGCLFMLGRQIKSDDCAST